MLIFDAQVQSCHHLDRFLFTFSVHSAQHTSTMTRNLLPHFFVPHVHAPAIVRGLAMMALAVGVGVWGAIVLAPPAREMPPMLPPPASQGFATTPVAQWFGGGNARVKVRVVGLIASGSQPGAALLSVNGAAPQAYRVGQTLAAGIRLDRLDRDTVWIDQDGEVEPVAVPRDPTPVVQGFVVASP